MSSVSLQTQEVTLTSGDIVTVTSRSGDPDSPSAPVALLMPGALGSATSDFTPQLETLRLGNSPVSVTRLNIRKGSWAGFEKRGNYRISLAQQIRS